MREIASLEIVHMLKECKGDFINNFRFNKFNNVYKMNKIFNSHELPKVSKEEIQ